jgi:TonB family protein
MYMDALKYVGMKPDESRPIPDDKIRRDLRNSGGPLADDGIANLQKTLEIDPQYAQALEYMNLFVRSRAYTDDTPEQFQKHIVEANDWAAKANKARPFPNRIRVGGNVEAANLIKKVVPKYSKEAKKAGIQGTVRFQVIIGKDGHVQSVQLVSGDPALVQAAQDAVQQWVYRPTLLNGQPVEVVTVIDVNFTLRP